MRRSWTVRRLGVSTCWDCIGQDPYQGTTSLVPTITAGSRTSLSYKGLLITESFTISAAQGTFHLFHSAFISPNLRHQSTAAHGSDLLELPLGGAAYRPRPAAKHSILSRDRRERSLANFGVGPRSGYFLWITIRPLKVVNWISGPPPLMVPDCVPPSRDLRFPVCGAAWPSSFTSKSV